MSTNFLLILTAPPHSPLAEHAVKLAETVCEKAAYENSSGAKKTQIATFFYMDAVQIANANTWQSADKSSITQAWQQLAKTYELDLPVCVSAALARGVTDADNAKRHQIYQVPELATSSHLPILANNLAEHFQLVGLGDLAEKLHWADKVIRL